MTTVTKMRPEVSEGLRSCASRAWRYSTLTCLHQLHATHCRMLMGRHAATFNASCWAESLAIERHKPLVPPMPSQTMLVWEPHPCQRPIPWPLDPPGTQLHLAG